MMKEKKEITYRGIAASPGISIGKVYLYKKEFPPVIEIQIDEKDIEDELNRLIAAIERSERELNKTLKFAKEKLPDHQLRIFEAQLLMLSDQYLIDEIKNRIRKEKKNADYILTDEIRKYQTIMMRSVKDDYLRERAFDVEDVKNRVVRNLNQQKLSSRIEGSFIIVSKRLTPADTVIFSRNEVLGYATDLGGYTSHAAILSRSLNIPAVLGLKEISETIPDDSTLILDGYRGIVIVNPREDKIKEYEQRRLIHRQFEKSLITSSGLPSNTLDNRKLKVFCNIEIPEEIDFAIQQGSEGIGLYRTEQVVIYRGEFPSEEEQFELYQEVVDKIYPREVIFRTFDIGGDKVLPQSYQESNPFLGWRGIRICLEKPELFNNQLRALLRASVRKNVKIMFPMVATLSEVRAAKSIIKNLMNDLEKEGIPFDKDLKIGAMIEVPSAAVIANKIAEEVDFLSIGTNDLIQYILAVDRGNELVSNLYNKFDPAVIRTIKHIISEGRKANIPVGMCGEMAADPITTILLIGLGLDEFSVVPGMLPEIKKIIQSVTFEEAKSVVESTLLLDTAGEIESYLKDFTKKKFPYFLLEE
jgi:phosphoenolpyruvate-protein phosphotransferase (PTS system enzyme I)